MSKENKSRLAEIIIGLLCLAMMYVAGCSRRYAQVVKPDGTQITLELEEVMSDKAIQDVEVMIDKETGEYSFAIKGYNSETSPVVTSILKAVYNAGKTAGGL